MGKELYEKLLGVNYKGNFLADSQPTDNTLTMLLTKIDAANVCNININVKIKGQLEESFELDRTSYVISVPNDVTFDANLFDEQLFVFMECAKYNYYLLKLST